jgi:gamma-glutamylcyclotransferase
MASPQIPIASSSSPTIYFGYGSNLWLHQMTTRCPTSTYLGVARLPNYHWIINDRGYANVVESTRQNSSSSTSSPTTSKEEKYDDVVFGLVYSLLPEDEKRLDKNEGVPVAYTKEMLKCDFWPSTTEHTVDTNKRPEKKEDMLVYIDRNRVTPDKPRDEYVYRMNQGIADAVKLGVPEGYVRDVMRKYIPAEEDDEEREGEREMMAEFARGQAAEFRDESGVFQ